MFTVLEFDDVEPRIRAGEQIVIVEQSPEYPGHLLFQTVDQVKFTRHYHEYLSRFSLLIELFMLEHFLGRLEQDGWEVVFLPDTNDLLQKHARYREPLFVEGLRLPDGLFPFQQYSLNRAFERADLRIKKSGFFFNWAPGTGKGSAAAAGIQELMVNRGEIDLAIFLTIRKMKINMARRVEGLTDVIAEVVDGSPQRRKKRYEAREAGCYVMNYEKAHFDRDAIEEMIRGQRVLWVLDEVQKVLFGENGSPTRSRNGFDHLVSRTKRSIVWPMSATIVKASPLRFHDVYRVQEMRNKNPLGTKEQFLEKYASRVDEVQGFGGPETRQLQVTWNRSALAEVVHHVGDMTQAVRKTSPGVREFFKDMTTMVVPVQMSPEDRKLYKAIERDAMAAGRSMAAQYYMLLRYVCNTPEALTKSESDLAPKYLEQYPDLITSKNSSKLETACELLEQIVEAGDKCVMFTQHTNLSMFIIAEELKRRGITYVLHYGTGMTDRQAQAAQDDFMSDESISVFLSSDAGAQGLNLQAARYVINYDVPYDPDILTQRNDRIDRADSHLDGLTAYVLVTEDTIEERIWQTQEKRRELSAIVQGTQEGLSRLDAATYTELSEQDALPELMFGTGSSLVAR